MLPNQFLRVCLCCEVPSCYSCGPGQKGSGTGDLDDLGHGRKRHLGPRRHSDSVEHGWILRGPRVGKSSPGNFRCLDKQAVRSEALKNHIGPAQQQATRHMKD